MLYYNITENQPDRPIAPTRAAPWIGASALAAAATLHALPLVILLTMAMPPAAAPEEAAITVFVDPDGAPVATASEVAPSARSAAAEMATPKEAPAERQLDDAVMPPQPIDAQPVPELRPAKPPPDLRDALPVPEVEEAESPDFRKQMPDLRDAVPQPELREAALPDFRQPAPVPPRQEAQPEPRKTAPSQQPQPQQPQPPSQQPQQTAAPKPVPQSPRVTGPAPSPSPAPATSPSPHGGVASAAPPAASARPSAAPAVEPGWNALLAAWLAANRRYPEEARRRGIEGEVTVRFSVAADGRVTDVAIVAGSGSSALDGAATAMLRGARLPPPGRDVTRTVRIRYRLAD